MWFDDSGEILQGAQFLPSPNFDQRPAGIDPELIVVHGISLPPSQFGGKSVCDLFTNRLNPAEDPYFANISGLQVSAHFYIRRGGEVIQFVSPKQRAWHAGLSNYRGREKCNDFSIGIELEGTDFTPYTAIQYDHLSRLISALWELYPLMPKDAVVGHNNIAPGRKTDPGPFFVWPALWRLLGG